MTSLAISPFVALDIESYVSLGIWLALLIVKVVALVDAVIHKPEFYVAADKQNKVFWLLLLGIFLALHLVLRDPLNFLNLIGHVAAFVYLADVRPTLRAMPRH
ncbi:MAG: DUF2516 family protein [Nocardioidaceae bacterium]|nr:DUF2516 family protein [Nocardioidaceae bacterium]